MATIDHAPRAPRAPGTPTTDAVDALTLVIDRAVPGLLTLDEATEAALAAYQAIVRGDVTIPGLVVIP